MNKTGFWFYIWGLVLNVGIVFLLIRDGGISGFGTTRVGWICAALAAYLLVAISIIKNGYPFHPILKYGLPFVVILLLGYEVSFGPSLNLVTLILLALGRACDIRGKRDWQER